MATVVENAPFDKLQDIESTLKTEVIDVLRNCLEHLSGMDRNVAYETVMNEPSVLHESFTLLKREPALFSRVIVDDFGESVEARDDQRLRCGETLGYIKTLVVRASAKRHFRRKLGGYRTVTIAGDPPANALQGVMQKLGLAKAAPPRKRKLPGRGDLLYRSMREFLLYDWQARLIPHYVHLTPELVDQIGASILEIREPNELRALAGEEGRNALAQKRPPLFLGGAQQVMRKGEHGIDPELLFKLWNQIGIDRLFQRIDMAEGRKVIAEVAATSKAAIALIEPILGADVRQFIVFLFVAYRQLGRIEYRNIFTDSGATQWVAKVFADRLAQLKEHPVPELEEMHRVFASVLSPPSLAG